MADTSFDLLRGLVVLQKIYQHGSFSAAARALGKSPSVVSHHVQRLETRLNAPLVHREGRQTRLTRQGKEAVARIADFAGALETLKHDLHEQAHALDGQLRIAIRFSLAPGPFIDNLCDFLTAHPKVGVDVEVVGRDFDLIDQGFDLFVTFGDLADSNLIQRKLYQVEAGFFVAPDKVGLWQPLIAHDCLQIPWIQVAGFDRKAWCDALAIQDPASRARAQFSHRANDFDMGARLAAAGHGVVALPLMRARHYTAAGRLVRIWPQQRLPDLNIYFLWPSKGKQNRLIDVLIAHLIANRRRVMAGSYQSGNRGE